MADPTPGVEAVDEVDDGVDDEVDDGVDDVVVAAAKAGDPEAWRTLYRSHAGRLVAWLATRPTGDTVALPEDVASEAWLVAASKISDFDGSSSDFAGYLFGIARKVAAGNRRRSDRRRTDPVDPADPTTDVVTVPDPTVEVVGRDWVRDAIAALPPRERDVVGLVDGLGFDNGAAAAVLGISPVAVRVARHRGLRRLRGSSGSVPAVHDGPRPPDQVVARPG